MRKILGLTVVPAVLLLSAGSCQGYPPTGGYVFNSAAISQSTLNAGDEFSVTVEVTNNSDPIRQVGLIYIASLLGGPADVSLPNPETLCSPFDIVPIDAATAQGTTQCTIPSFLPSGDWRMLINATSGLPIAPDTNGGANQWIDITVTNGTSDVDGPTLSAQRHSPDPILRQNFAIWVTASEVNGPIDYRSPIDLFAAKGGFGSDLVFCTKGGIEAVSSTEYDIRLNCSMSILNIPGHYQGTIGVVDAIGNESTLPYTFESQ